MRPIAIYVFIALIATSSLAQHGNEVIAFSTHLKIENGKYTEVNSYLIQINQKQSNWISKIQIPFQDDDKIKITEASILDLNGKVLRKLKNKDIITRSAISSSSLYEDSFIHEFDLKWHTYPYRIQYSYERTVDSFLGVNWSPAIYSSVPTRHAALKVEIPFGYRCSLDYPDSFSFKADTTANGIQLKWTGSYTDLLHEEMYSPPLEELTPQVRIVPHQFDYGAKGSFESWASFGAWVYRLNQGLDQLTPSEQNKVDALIKGLTEKKEIVKTLYHYLQDNTRYINVSIDLGGLKPYPASYVCEKKYGDCKALTMYMKSLLKYAGIPSYYTLVYSGDNPIKVDENLPGQQFDHVILCVPVAGDTLWLENTAGYLPYNYLGSFTQGRNVLVVNNENSCLVRTPATTLDGALTVNKYTFELSEDGSSKADVTYNLRGEAFDRLRYVRSTFNDADQKKYIERKLPSGNHQLTAWSIEPLNRDTTVAQVNVEMTSNDQLRKIADLLVLQPIRLKLPELERPAVRKNPMRVPYPVNILDSITYKVSFSETYETQLPERIDIESPYGRYIEQFAFDESKDITVTSVFQLYKGDYPTERYPEIYAFIEAIKDARTKAAIIFKHQ